MAPKKPAEIMQELEELAKEAQKVSEFLKAPPKLPFTPPGKVPAVAAVTIGTSDPKIPTAGFMSLSPPPVVGDHHDLDDSDFLDISKVDGHLVGAGSPDMPTKSVAGHIFSSPLAQGKSQPAAGMTEPLVASSSSPSGF